MTELLDQIRIMAGFCEKSADPNAKYDGYYVRTIFSTKFQSKLLVLTNSDTQILVFRSTANFRNIISDLEFWKTDDPYLQIHLHRGFRDAARELYFQLQHVILPNKKTYITGHSFGGAQAVIVGLMLLEDSIPIERIITFGQPKVTDWNGCKKYWGVQLVRVVNDVDPVPVLPPRTLWYPASLFYPYRHFGTEFRIFDDKETVQMRGSAASESFEAPTVAYALFSGKASPDAIVGHYMSSYIKNLDKAKF